MSPPTSSRPVARAESSAAAVVRLEGPFDVSNVEEFERAASETIHSGQPNFVVDMSGVSFLDSQMLHALSRARELALESDGSVVLVRPRPELWRLFGLVGLDRLFRAFDSLQAAIAYRRPGSAAT